MKITGWMVTKKFEVLSPLTVYAPERTDFPDGVFSFDKPNIRTLVFAAQGYYKYVDGIPTSGDHELMIVGGQKDGVYVNFNAAKAEYAALEASAKSKGGDFGSGSGPGSGGNSGSGFGDNLKSTGSWFKKNLVYILVPGLVIAGAYLLFGKKIRSLFRK